MISEKVIKNRQYLFDDDFLVWYSDYFCGGAMKHFAGRDIDIVLGGDVFVSGGNILSSDIFVVIDVVCYFAEGVGVEVFGFDGVDVSGVAWDVRIFVEFFFGHVVVLVFGRDVSKVKL